jgi:DNA-binding NtrC family response regulator
MKSVLIITKAMDAVSVVRSCFESDALVSHRVEKQAAMQLLEKRPYDFVFTDIRALKESARENGYKAIFQPFWHLHPSIEIIVMAPQEMIREAVRAVKEGASDYLTYPLNVVETKYVIENICEKALVQSELGYLRDQFWELDELDVVQTKSPLMRVVYDKIRSVAQTRSTILLIGETGVGKGVLASLIHRHSNRRNAQFISVHCGAIPDTLLESELFGHEKGAFTGAIRRKLGKFEIAHGGTIFLDEIGTVTPLAQIKLLQVLQDGTFQRVGGEENIKTDCRVIAATNADLKKMSETGQFRKDLYYRLDVFPMEIPPLRARLEDIPHFVELFLKRMNRESTREIRDVDPQVLEAFRRYSWPGNIREIENLLERAYILENSPILTSESFPSELFESINRAAAVLPIYTSVNLAEVRKRGIEKIERGYLKNLLESNKGKINDSALAAGVSSLQLHKLMKRYGLRKEQFK